MIAPVEVDAPGCSYNPDRAQHQEAVARAVAEENAKLIDAELQAQPPPKHVDWQPETDPMMAFQARRWPIMLTVTLRVARAREEERQGMKLPNQVARQSTRASLSLQVMGRDA